MALAMGVASCELERDHNGDLAGYWHLERVDTLQTGGVKDMRPCVLGSAGQTALGA